MQKWLKRARDADFSLFYPLGHDFGKIRCPGNHPGARHEETVSSTSGNASGATSAEFIRRKLRKCEAACKASAAAPPAIDAASLIDRVDHLITSVEFLIRTEALRTRSTQELEEAVASGEPLVEEGLTEAADQHDRKAQEYEVQARLEAARFGFTDRFPPERGSRALLELAQEQIDEIVGSPLSTEDRAQIGILQARTSELTRGASDE